MSLPIRPFALATNVSSFAALQSGAIISGQSGLDKRRPPARSLVSSFVGPNELEFCVDSFNSASLLRLGTIARAFQITNEQVNMNMTMNIQLSKTLVCRII